ncbi:MAG: rhamnulokinase family protein [Bacillota bacterium]
MKKVLAFDFGASSGRGILATYTDGNLTYEEIHRFENTPIEENGTLYWDFPTLFKEVEIAIEKAGAFDSVGFDTWGVDFGLLDADGKLLEKPVHYRDKRTEQTVARAEKILSQDEIYAKTGNQIMALNTLFQLMETDLTGAKTLLFMPDLFAYQLCGAKNCEMTIASTSQMLDLEKKVWHEEVLEKFNIPKEILLPPTKTGKIIGKYKGVADVVAVAGHDTQCAVASLPTDEEVLFLSCGTWSLLGAELETPILSAESRSANLSNEIGANGKINYLKNIIGLWLIQESRRVWQSQGKAYTFSELADLAKEAKPFQFFIDPDAPQFASPGDIPKLVQEFCEKTGQGRPESIGEIMRCIYESLALKYRFSVEQVKELTGKNFSKLHMLGGGIQAKLLCEMTASATNMEVIAGPVEATALGNIIIQLVAIGELESIANGRELIKKTEPVITYQPTDGNLWADTYKKYKECVL